MLLGMSTRDEQSSSCLNKSETRHVVWRRNKADDYLALGISCRLVLCSWHHVHTALSFCETFIFLISTWQRPFPSFCYPLSLYFLPPFSHFPTFTSFSAFSLYSPTLSYLFLSYFLVCFPYFVITATPSICIRNLEILETSLEDAIFFDRLPNHTSFTCRIFRVRFPVSTQEKRCVASFYGAHWAS